MPGKTPSSATANKQSSRTSNPRAVEPQALADWVHSILPTATVQRKMNGVSCMIGGKVFAFTRPEGVTLKLPEARVEELIDSRDAGFLVMGKKAMREWVVLRYGSPGEFLQDGKIFAEAMKFVESLEK